MKGGVFKLGFVVLGFILLVSLFSVSVFADELSDCVNDCKVNNELEDDRNVCIIDCQSKFEFKEDFRDDDFDEGFGDKVKICHIPPGNPDKAHTLEVSESAVEEHRSHGDSMGECNEGEESNGEDFEDLEKEYSHEEIRDGGTGPDSVFYFLDEFMDNFGDDLEVREEKVAEIKAMIEKGDFKSARKALKNYKEKIQELKKEINPEKRDEARRSAVAIKQALNEAKDSISEENQKEFIDDVLAEEIGIVTAVEISSKIQELCEQLASLDPFEYNRICKIDDDAPEWRKKKNKEWTEEQRKEAKEFGDIMKDCFRTSGRDCRCEEIGFYDFSITCEKASVFAVKCDEGDENACKDLDEIEMPELPEHLQDVFDELEAKEAQYEGHMPEECVRVGATTPKECSRVMIEKEAPIECKQALLDSGCDKERECREICDKIMFDLYAPQECIDAGITDMEECGRNRFQREAPQECLDAGITGNRRDDPEKCRELMEGKIGGRGPGRGPDCMNIPEPMERLKCFEGKLSSSGEYYGPKGGDGEITWQCKENRIHWLPDCEKFMREEWPNQERMKFENREDIEKREKECAQKCESENAAWDFSGGNCKCFNHQEGKGGSYDCSTMYCDQGSYCDPYRGCVRDDYNQGPECGDCSSQCPAGANTDCVDGSCVCGEVPDTGPRYTEGEGPGDLGDYDNNEEFSTTGEGGGEPSLEPSLESSGGDAGITGGVISNNGFLKYYFG